MDIMKKDRVEKEFRIGLFVFDESTAKRLLELSKTTNAPGDTHEANAMVANMNATCARRMLDAAAARLAYIDSHKCDAVLSRLSDEGPNVTLHFDVLSVIEQVAGE